MYRAVNTSHLGYKNQSVYAVSGTSRCLFSDKYKTHKYSVGRGYNCWMLNCWCITWPVGFKRLISGVLLTRLPCDPHQICAKSNFYSPRPNKTHYFRTHSFRTTWGQKSNLKKFLQTHLTKISWNEKYMYISLSYKF